MKIDLEALKLKHPEAFGAVFAAGRESGIAAERDRVAGLLRAGELSGASELAHAAIRDGREVAALSTQFLEAGLRRRHQQNRQADDDALGEITTAREGGTPGDAGDTVAAIVTGKRAVPEYFNAADWSGPIAVVG